MASLPDSPWTDIEDFRVAVDAPVSTDLMTDIVVNLNYLYTGLGLLGGVNVQNITSTGTFTVPAGITKLLVRMWAGGGGGASGNSSAGGAGNNGSAGGDTWFLAAGNKARGGLGGLAAFGSGPSARVPVIAASLVQYGTLGGSAAASDTGATTTNLTNHFQLYGAAGGATGSAGQANTGQAGGGANGADGLGGGGAGAHGEFAEFYVTVAPGDVITATIGAGGAGGANKGFGLGDGGAGGTGFIQVVY